MKSQDVLEAMRKAALRIMMKNNNIAMNFEHWQIAYSGLNTLEDMAIDLYGPESEEDKEFTYYRRNFDKPMPQPAA